MGGDVVPIVCKNCGSATFETSSGANRYEDLIGAKCAECGTVVTDQDIKAQAIKIADSLLKDAFKNFG